MLTFKLSACTSDPVLQNQSLTRWPVLPQGSFSYEKGWDIDLISSFYKMLLLPFSPPFLNLAVHSWKGIYYKFKILENPITWNLHLWISFPWTEFNLLKGIVFNGLCCYQMMGERDAIILASMVQIILFWCLEVPWCVIISCYFKLLWSVLYLKKNNYNSCASLLEKWYSRWKKKMYLNRN